MSTLKLSEVIGQCGQLQDDSALRFAVRILDAKQAYGRIRYQVTPVSGTGSVWVDASRVKISEEKGDGQ